MTSNCQKMPNGYDVTGVHQIKIPLKGGIEWQKCDEKMRTTSGSVTTNMVISLCIFDFHTLNVFVE